MDTARELQLEIFRGWTPEERLLAGFKMIGLAVSLRNARIRMKNPDANEEELSDLRCRAALDLSANDPLPWNT